MRHPAEIVLRALMGGQELEMDDLVFKLEGHTRLLFKRKGSSKMKFGPGKVTVVEHEPWVGCDMRVDQFLSMCVKIPRDDLFMLGANTALTEINREGARRRPSGG